jgi:ribosomal protein S18 acetylase RimI-like enzyme
MTQVQVREIRDAEFAALGRLMVEVYSNLEGFPQPHEQPGYYRMLADIGRFTEKPQTHVLVALTAADELVGGVVYFADMAQYGSGGTATAVKNASGIRLLGVSPAARNMGVGRALTLACVERARARGHAEVVLHTTAAMRVAWGLYERLGFVRSADLDFLQEGMPVYGFKLRLAGG